MRGLKKQLQEHVKEHLSLYFFLVILFITGIIFGAIIVNSMNFTQKQDLYFYLEQYFHHLIKLDQIDFFAILKDSFYFHTKYLLLIFILGLTIIGVPFIWILLFAKGAVIGFTVGFFVNQLGGNGFLLAALFIVPQNIIAIPLYLFACGFAMQFTFALFEKLFSKRYIFPIQKAIVHYATAFFALVILSICSSFLEAVIANQALTSFIKTLYQSTQLFF